jgi:pilus assembly protein CpaC
MRQHLTTTCLALAALLAAGATAAEAQQLQPQPRPRAATPPAAVAAPIGPDGQPLTQLQMRDVTRQGSVTQTAGVPFMIEAGAGRILQLARPAASVFAADPRVVEVRPASPTSLFVFGVAPGRTTIAALDAAGAPVAQYEVTIRPSAFGASEAQSALSRVLPGRTLRVETHNNGLALSGEVRDAAEAERALSITRGFAAEGQGVDNRLTVLGQVQVNLRVRIAEVSREVTRQLGIDWQAIGSFGRFSVGLVTRSTIADPLLAASRLALGYSDGRLDINNFIDALAQERLITVLAEPNLTAMSGESASFLAGGEFPIPVGLRDDLVTIEFKQYGVSLAFVPTVMSQGRISLRVRPEVSELTEQGAIRLGAGNTSIQIPALAVRRAETTVELGSGQSFAIAGLLQDSSRNLGRAVPLVGEVPVLGALFRSDRFQRNETELVIIITPYIVRPVNDPSALRSPLDGFVPPDDVERLLLFRQVARDRPAPPRVPGDAGFILF